MQLIFSFYYIFTVNYFWLSMGKVNVLPEERENGKKIFDPAP